MTRDTVERPSTPKPLDPLERRQLMANTTLAAADTASSREDVDEGFWIDLEQERLVFRYPADRAVFPWNVVLVEVREKSTLMHSTLMPVRLNAGKTHFCGTLEFDDLLGGLGFSESMEPVCFALHSDLLDRVSTDQVKRLLDSQNMQSRDGVRERIEQLLELLETPGTGCRNRTGI